jgi:hypothetical protein
VLADNQEMIGKALMEAGAALIVNRSSIEHGLADVFHDAPSLRQFLSQTPVISAVTDGQGAARVADLLMGSEA